MIKKFALSLLAVAILSSSAFFLFPQIELFSDRVYLAICFFAFTTQTISLFLFLASLKAFKKELKTAYIILAIGILFSSIPLIQLPILTFIEIDALVMSWSVVIFSLVGALIMYVAVRKFAGLLKIRTTHTSTLFSMIAATTLAFASTFLPHPELPFNEKVVDGIFACFIAAGTLNVISALLVLQIRKKLGQIYKAAMGWLAAALFTLSFANLHETLTKLLPVFNEEIFVNYFIYGFALWPFFIAALIFLKASISFQATSVLAKELPEDASSLDVVSYVAQMVSDPVAIDITLDKVRKITAAKGSNATFSAADETSLQSVYLTIETYLTTKEPLRKLTKDDLRNRLPEHFLQALGSK